MSLRTDTIRTAREILASVHAVGSLTRDELIQFLLRVGFDPERIQRESRRAAIQADRAAAVTASHERPTDDRSHLMDPRSAQLNTSAPGAPHAPAPGASAQGESPRTSPAFRTEEL